MPQLARSFAISGIRNAADVIFYTRVAHLWRQPSQKRHSCTLSKRRTSVFILPPSFPAQSTPVAVVNHLFWRSREKMDVPGSMLWSQFSAIFAKFRRKKWRFLLKTNVTIHTLQKLEVHTWNKKL
jgi:hypothetical protein